MKQITLILGLGVLFSGSAFASSFPVWCKGRMPNREPVTVELHQLESSSLAPFVALVKIGRRLPVAYAGKVKGQGIVIPFESRENSGLKLEIVADGMSDSSRMRLVAEDADLSLQCDGS